MEFQLAFAKGALERRNKLATKDATKHLDGKKESVTSFDPAGVIGGESAGGHDAVHVRVMLEFLVPGVQDAEEADLRTEMFGIASHFQKSFRTASKQ